MSTNPYTDWFSPSPEGDMLHELTIEAIKFAGMDINYLPRRKRNFSDVNNQDDLSLFDTAYTIEMYMENLESFGGEGNFLTKFGLEVRDRLTLKVATKRFQEEVGRDEDFVRPREGDLIWFPMGKKLFEITYVDNKTEFYPLGELPAISITCELFEYNNEEIKTGNSEIDAIQTKFSTDKIPYMEIPVGGTTPILSSIFDNEDLDPEYDNEEFSLDLESMGVSNTQVIISNPYKGE